jgi:hypothetical protein
MDNDSKVTIQNLGTFFYILVLNAIYLIVYYFLALFEKFSDRIRKLRKQMEQEIFWGVFLILALEGYLDFCLSILVNLEEPYFNTTDDIINMCLTYFLLPTIFILPPLAYFILRKNKDQFNRPKFTRKFGVLYDGLRLFNDTDRKNVVLTMPWFLTRRFFMAILIIWGRYFTVWFQLSFNVWFVLADSSFKQHFSPFESKLGGFLEKHNDMYVLFCSYLLFCFTAFTLTPVNKEFYGWMFVISIGVMSATNIAILIGTATVRGLKSFRTYIVQKMQNRRR